MCARGQKKENERTRKEREEEMTQDIKKRTKENRNIIKPGSAVELYSSHHSN
jgi:hypothetical protein